MGSAGLIVELQEDLRARVWLEEMGFILDRPGNARGLLTAISELDQLGIRTESAGAGVEVEFLKQVA